MIFKRCFSRVMRQQDGFTRIELLVGVSIVAVLASFLMPALCKAWSLHKVSSTEDENSIDAVFLPLVL